MDYSATSLIEADIQGACSSLGSWTSKGYTKDPDCIESLKDILRYLKRDSGSHEVRRLLGRIQVLNTDLLPLLKFYHDDSLLFELLLRLLVNLTNPAILLYKEELPQEKSARNDYMEIVAHLQSYKKAFTDSKVWEAIVKKLESLLYMSPQERGDEENDTIERMLVMVRNVVHVPANPTEEKRTDDDVSVHDQVLWAMHLAKMEDLLLYICTSDVDQDYCFHALEILSLMLREQSPQVLASAGQGRSNTEKMEDELELLKMREMELSQKKKQMQARMGRHPRFGGTFTVQNMQAIGDNKLIAHSPLNKLCEIDFDQTKSFHAKPKNKRPTEDGKIMRRSTLNIRLFLKSLCEDFLKLAYNPMMKTVKRHLQRNKAQSNDESYYFWSVQFFMEFCRQSHSDISLVSETLSKETFHYIQTQMEQYYEMMVTEKRKIRLWAKRLHVALKAYRELVKSLAAMDSSQDERVKEASRVLKGTIFYMPEYREVVLYLLLNFNDCVQPISYLRDLAETVHVYLKMLEQFAKQTRHVIVQEKKKSKKKAKPKKSQRPAIQREEDEQLLWLEVAPDLSKTIQRKEELPSDIVVFDPTLGTSEEEHMLDATRRIERALKSKKPAEALAILRSARQLWPEKQAFGSDDISPDDEFMMLREMFFAKLDTSEERDKDQNNEEEDEEEDESEGEGETAAEKEFSFLAFIKRFANPKVIIAYSKLLSNFRENSPTVNHCTARMFHRLAWDLKLEPMMFQASVFRVFQEVMADYSRLSKSSADTGLKDLNRLATYVVRCFVEHASKNNLAMMELLFWKNSKDAYELQFGYGSSATKKTSKVSWTEEEELELKALYDRFNEQATPEKDVVDYIMENIIDQKKTRRAIILHLKNLGLVDKNKAFKKKVSVQRQWKEDEVNELQELFEKYKESTDIMGMITEHMSVKRPRHRIVDKLLELGLVSDKKELRKKRSRKNDFDNWRGHGGSVSEIDTSSSDDDDQDRVHVHRTVVDAGADVAASGYRNQTTKTERKLPMKKWTWRHSMRTIRHRNLNGRRPERSANDPFFLTKMTTKKHLLPKSPRMTAKTMCSCRLLQLATNVWSRMKGKRTPSPVESRPRSALSFLTTAMMMKLFAASPIAFNATTVRDQFGLIATRRRLWTRRQLRVRGLRSVPW
ncbi:protein timeless homolog isoform X2 [Ornithodoros turicata]|uniref:protein timeless homolog isoform X2 n=1 Tax=Ornithodoros turicata TaxID=34597 RepID=UPI003138AD9B